MVKAENYKNSDTKALSIVISSVALTAPTITNHPQNQTANVGDRVIFGVTATGIAPLIYQWQRNSGNGWSNISGANTAYYSLYVEAIDDGAQFRVVVRNSYGGVTSNVARLWMGDFIIIRTAEELDEVRKNPGARYKLDNDIYLGDYLKSSAEGWLPIGTQAAPFKGRFDGSGFVISGLWVERPSTDNVGLFGVTENAEIKNLGVEIVGEIKGRRSVGGLVGWQSGSDITKSYATGNVTGTSDVGGIVGWQTQSSNITNSYATGCVRGGSYVGGLVGGQEFFLGGGINTIANSYATGDVRGGSYVGGLVGGNYVYQGSGINAIANSYAAGNVSGTSRVGGLVGYQLNSNITNSYATGNVSGTSWVGGLVGHQLNSNITNSYATGDITGSGVFYVGGLVGSQSNSTVANSYATGDVSGNLYVGGLVGSQSNSSIANSYATGNLTEGSSIYVVGALVGTQSGGSTTNSYRYINLTLNGTKIPENERGSEPDGMHGGTVTAGQLLWRETYSDNGWLFTPSGPWHWDDRDFPKLNIGTENFPFRFDLAVPMISIVT